MHDDIKTVLLTKEEIDARVQEMGKQIAADYAGKELVVIVLLKGAAWFAARRLHGCFFLWQRNQHQRQR